MDRQKICSAIYSKRSCNQTFIFHASYGDVLGALETELVSPCTNIAKEHLIYIDKYGGILCSFTTANMFLWELKFSSAKNWGEGSTFPVVPSRLLHLNFSNTPLAHFSVNIRSSPKSFERVGFFALTKPAATLKSCCLLMHLQDSVLYLF